MYDHDPMGRINIPALRFFMTSARVLVGAALVLIVVGITALFVLDLEGSFRRDWRWAVRRSFSYSGALQHSRCRGRS